VVNSDFGNNLSNNVLRAEVSVLNSKEATKGSKFRLINFDLSNNNLKFVFFTTGLSLSIVVTKKFISFKNVVDLNLRSAEFLPYQKSNYYLHYIKNFPAALVGDSSAGNERLYGSQDFDLCKLLTEAGLKVFTSGMAKEIVLFYEKRYLSTKNKFIHSRSFYNHKNRLLLKKRKIG
jgi:hypothetical protein